MTPGEQARGCLAADVVFLERLDGATDAELDAVQLTMFGMPSDAARLLTMRLAEHAVHTWDVLVMNDPAATIGPDAVDGVLDNVKGVAGWTAKPAGLILEAEVITTEPTRALRLSVGDVVTLSAAGAEARPAAEVRMPAESLIRLVYGRLDADCSTTHACSPSSVGCGTTFSYYCHTPSDDCDNDSDCRQEQFCQYAPGDGKWTCVSAGSCR